MDKQIKLIDIEDRECEACSSKHLESLWSYERVAKSATKKWRFNVNNCICKNCGFVFVSPGYTENSLADYYADARTYFLIDYDIGKRVSVLRKYANTKGKYLEIGAKQKTKFHDDLTPLFSSVSTQGLEDVSNCDVNKVDEKDNETIDVLAHYFVLEHVPKIKKFLEECWSLLKFEGIMVVEVPDLNKYPSDIAALMLYEHTNHFSLKSLVNICSHVGFELIESDDKNASRPFGMIAIFKKTLPVADKIKICNDDYHTNKKTFLGGLEIVENYYAQITKVRQEIYRRLSLSEKIIIWAANDISDTLIGQTDILDSVTIIDSDPKKLNYFETKHVKTPDMASELITQADFIVICTGQWSDQILKSIKNEFSKEFAQNDVQIVDYYFG